MFVLQNMSNKIDVIKNKTTRNKKSQKLLKEQKFKNIKKNKAFVKYHKVLPMVKIPKVGAVRRCNSATLLAILTV